MSILNVNKINPVGGGSTITIAGIASVTNSVTAPTFVGNINNSTLLLQTGGSERLRITSGGSVGINANTPSAGDMASGASFAAPKIHVGGDGSQSGAYELLARFESGTDADNTGATIVLNHGNDRGLAIQGGRRTGNYAHGALKMVDNVGRLSDAMLIHGGAGVGVDHINFYTGISTVTTIRLHINNAGNVGINTNFTGSQTWRAGQRLEIFGGTGNVTGELHLGANRGDGTQSVGSINFFDNTQDTSHKHVAIIEVDKAGSTSNKRGGDLIFYTKNDNTASPTEKLRISSAGYVTKPQNPVFHAFGGPSNVAVNTDIVFGQVRFDIGGGYNTSNGIYTAPATGYYHFYAQVYRQTTENDAWWGFYINGAHSSESRMQNNYGGDSGRGYSTLQSSIYWYMTAGDTIKCRVGNTGAIHCNNTLSYFCGNLVG